MMLFYTGCRKKLVTLFVKAVIFKPRIARGWYYTHFEAYPLRLEMSTYTSHNKFGCNSGSKNIYVKYEYSC